VPYLEIEPSESERWKQRLAGPARVVKVGLVWAGNKENLNDLNRSIRLSMLSPLAAVEWVDFYSLQKGEPAAQATSDGAGFNLIDFTDELQNFDHTAALIQNLDLVISVDTSVAHLAGALGKPVWIMVPFSSDWRWMLGREDSPWYPSMRLFRQKAAGDWKDVVGRVTTALAELVSASAS
jgi:hypothetical protein